jgi:hypothetical protein
MLNGSPVNDMERLQVADGGEGLQTWRVAVNILNKELQTANRGWPSSLQVEQGDKNCLLQNL